MVVSHNPIRPSQDAVSRLDPDGFEAIEESGAVCRWSVARGFGAPSPSRFNSVIWAVRSCEAVAISV